MTTTQKIIKAFAIILAIAIISGIISSIINIVSYFLPEKETIVTPSDTQELIQLSNINNIEIELNRGKLNIETIPTSRPQISIENKNIKYTEKNGVLKITEKGLNITKENTILLRLPQNTALNTIKINSVAGAIYLNNVTTQYLDLDLGTGKVNINNIKVTNEADIDAGAGNLSMTNYYINKLDLDLGVGNTNLLGLLGADSKIDCGLGSLNLTIPESLTKYALDIEKGIGEITLNDEKLTQEEYQTNGEIPLEIEGGVGNITIKTN